MVVMAEKAAPDHPDLRENRVHLEHRERWESRVPQGLKVSR